MDKKKKRPSFADFTVTALDVIDQYQLYALFPEVQYVKPVDSGYSRKRLTCKEDLIYCNHCGYWKNNTKGDEITNCSICKRNTLFTKKFC